MTDKITSVQQNQDGSFTFGFLFDAGNGVTGSTNCVLPAPQGTPAVTDETGAIITPAVDAVPYTLETAKTAVLSIASEQKANWINTLGSTNVVGEVTLP